MRTRACSRTSIARTEQAALTHNVRGKELKGNNIILTTVIKVVAQNFSNRYLNKQRKYLEEFSSRFCVIKLKLK